MILLISDKQKALATKPGFKRVNTNLIVNYSRKTLMLNRPEAIAIARDKLKTFEALAGKVTIPKYTISKEVASQWDKVFVRSTVTGSQGSGISVINTNESELPDAPLYVKAILGSRIEYRLHVVRSSLIFVQQKRKMSEEKMTGLGFTFDSRVRSYHNGWVFTAVTGSILEFMICQAIEALEIVGLDFGAVDIISKDGRFYILEINSNPAITSTTGKERYEQAFRNIAANT